MIQSLCDVLRKHLAAQAPELSDVFGGMAEVWKTNTGKTMSAFWDYEAQAHVSLVPDATKKAILYFEDNGTAFTSGPHANRTNLTLVGWVNETKHTITTPQLIQGLKTAFNRPFSGGDFKNISIEFKAMLPEGPNLFSKYNYEEGVRQYLHKPYDAFGIQISVSYNILPCPSI